MQSAQMPQHANAAAHQHVEGAFSLMCFGSCPTVTFASGLHISALSGRWERCHHVVSYRTGADGRLLIVAAREAPTQCRGIRDARSAGCGSSLHPCGLQRILQKVSYARIHAGHATLRPAAELARSRGVQCPALPLQREEHH